MLSNHRSLYLPLLRSAPRLHALFISPTTYLHAPHLCTPAPHTALPLAHVHPYLLAFWYACLQRPALNLLHRALLPAAHRPSTALPTTPPASPTAAHPAAKPFLSPPLAFALFNGSYANKTPRWNASGAVIT